MVTMITAAELSRQSRISMRQVQTWTNAGALLPETDRKHPGRGGTRLYPSGEVDVAKTLGAISHHGMSVNEVTSVADVVRKVVLAPQTYQFADLREAMELRGVILARLRQDRLTLQKQAADVLERHGARWRHIKTQAEDADFVGAWIAIELAKRGELFLQLCFYRAKDGGRLVKPSLLSGRRIEFDPVSSRWSAGYVLNLAEIFGQKPKASSALA